jgi:O-antigen/teichoic acid export membrane protein
MTNITKEKQIITNNIFWLTISKVLVYLLSFITVMLIPRYLGVEGYGQLNFVLSFIGVFLIFGDLGINTLTLREVSKNNNLAKKYFNNLFLFKILLSLFLSVIIIVVSFIINKPLIVKQILILSTVYLSFNILSNFCLKFLQSFQKLKYQSIYDILVKAFYVVFVLLFIYFNLGIAGVFWAHILTAIIGFLYILFSLKKQVKINLKQDFLFIKKTMIKAWPFALGVLFTNIYFHFDTILISFIHGEYYVGLYSIGYTLYRFLLNMLSIFTITFFPVIARYAYKKNLNKVVSSLTYVILSFSIPLTIGGIFLSKQIISFAFGKQYLNGIVPFNIILVFFLISSVKVIFVYLLYNRHYEKFVLKFKIYATIINVLLNILVIPVYGIVGAAITTVISEWILFVVFYFKVMGITRINLLKLSLKPFFASLFMLLVLFLIRDVFKIVLFRSIYDALFFVVIGIASYLLFFILIKGISKEQMIFFKKTIFSFFLNKK